MCTIHALYNVKNLGRVSQGAKSQILLGAPFSYLTPSAHFIHSRYIIYNSFKSPFRYASFKTWTSGG